jgi:hypothetical protein
MLATEGVSAEEDAWLIPDDGIIDQIAVSVAVYGERHVQLTYSERIAAATTALRHGSTITGLCIRLGLPYILSEDLMCRKLLPIERNSAA